MIWKNAELHGVAELIEKNDGGFTPLRMPQWVKDGLDSDGSRLYSSTGIEIRFVLKGEKAVIKLSPGEDPVKAGTFKVFRGGIQGGWQDNKTVVFDGNVPRELEITRAQNLGRLNKMTEKADLPWDPEVIRVIPDTIKYTFHDIIGDIEPPAPGQKPKKTLLCYGSSITHGSNSLSVPQSWVSVVAHNLKMDHMNLGMAGNCRLEPTVAEYIARLGEEGKWDVATLELGINVLSWDETKIRERSENMIRQVAGRNPEKPVFVISPFCFFGDEFGDKNGDKWRNILKEITEKLNFKNVTYINGMDIIGDSSLYISADEVHPNIYGCMKIAEKLEEKIREALYV